MTAKYRLQREVEKIKTELLLLSGKVERAIDQAIKALENRDRELARTIIERDEEIDTAEVDLEEACLKILALHQPVASDLRFMVAVLKINSDLERIGDLAASIAERAIFQIDHGCIEIPFPYREMAGKAQWMVRSALDAFVTLSPSLAQKVRDADDEVDAIHREMYFKILAKVKENPDRAEALINLIGLSRALERMADQATNIAEDVIYLVEGEIVRHHHGQPPRS
ncbi:MAG: phosphate signaling complex protein PhoU [Myxococcota bacterium]|jgi:phosphate transport system protein|nr:phosphate signaling complex protein PhoU [Myxococcota bacterium]